MIVEIVVYVNENNNDLKYLLIPIMSKAGAALSLEYPLLRTAITGLVLSNDLVKSATFYSKQELILFYCTRKHVKNYEKYFTKVLSKFLFWKLN